MGIYYISKVEVRQLSLPTKLKRKYMSNKLNQAIYCAALDYATGLRSLDEALRLRGLLWQGGQMSNTCNAELAEEFEDVAACGMTEDELSNDLRHLGLEYGIILAEDEE